MHLGADQLDGRPAREQAMLGFPHFAHAAMPEQLDQLVAAQLSRFTQLVSDMTKKTRRDGRQRGARIVGPEDHERPKRRRHGHAAQMRKPDAEGSNDAATSAAASILPGLTGATIE